MSTGRGRSWRPEKKRGGRASRQRAVAFLTVVLVSLIVALLVAVFGPKEPPLRFVSMVPGSHSLDPSGLPVLPSSASVRTGDRLKDVFTKLHELNEHLVLVPQTASSLQDLGELKNLEDAVKSGEKLVLYCGLETAVRYDSKNDVAVVKLLAEGGQPEIAFSALLSRLKEEVGARQVLLLMDLVRRESGLANGRLGDDVLHLIEAAVRGAENDHLVVICSSGFGERSWEYFESTDEGDVANDTPPDDDARAVDRDQGSGIFSGTVFGHFVRQAFIDGRTGDVGQFNKYLKREVAAWVEANYGEKQTVTLFLEEPRILGDGLLVNVKRPSASDLADSETSAGDSESIDVSESSEQIAETDTSDAEETPTTKIARLTAVQRDLAQAGEAVAATPAAWMELNSALLAAETAILHGDRAAYDKMLDEAGLRVRKIEDDLDRLLRPPGAESGVAEWITAPADDTQNAADDLKLNTELDRLFEDVGNSEETGSRVPSRFRSLGRERSAFVHRFVDELRQVADSKTPTDRLKRIKDHAHFIKQLPERGWRMQDWPGELLTIAEVLLADDDAARQAEAVELLLNLITLRTEVLNAGTGKLSNGAMMRSDVWNYVLDEVQQLVTDLTAAERWLAFGRPGLEQAKSTLREVKLQWGRLKDQIRRKQQLLTIRDSQRTDLPILIQFLAQQQEEVRLGNNELEDAIGLANAILENESEIRHHFPNGLLDLPNMDARHIDAMFALTRGLNETIAARSDVGDLERLIEYVQQRSERSEQRSASERLRLFAASAPGLNSVELDRSRRQLAASLTRNPEETSVTPDQRKQTGIWLSFWSIRLLEAISGVQQIDLWEKWKELVESVADEGEKKGIVVLARSQLSSLLRSAWNDQHLSLAYRKEAKFVRNDEVRSVIAADVAQRHAASEKHRGVYEGIYDNLGATVRLNDVEVSPTSFYETTFDNSRHAEISVHTEGADFLYVSAGEIELQGDSALDDGWQRIESPTAIQSLNFDSPKVVTEPVRIFLAFANKDHVVLRKRTVVLRPSSDITWNVEFWALNDGRQSRQVLQERSPDGHVEHQLELAPTTQSAKGDKNNPLSYIIQLVPKPIGVVKQVEVQVFYSRNERFWEKPQVLDVDPQTNKVLVLPDPENALAKTFDVLHGFRFEITPVVAGGRETIPRKIHIQPVLATAEHLVVRPRPKFGRNGKLSIPIVRDSRSRLSDLPPATVRAEVHFSHALGALLKPGGKKSRNVTSDGTVFEFTFKNGIVQALRQDDIERDDKALEFSVSVAGIPYAWHWRLDKDGPELLSDEPTVRIELNHQNPQEAKSVADSPKYVFGKNWDLARLDVRAHIHGGDFSRNDDPWQLDIKLLNDSAFGRKQPESLLDAPFQLDRRYREKITMAPGEKNAWRFLTHTELYGLSDLRISDHDFEEAGRYKLIAQLKRTNSAEIVEHEIVEHETEFTFDHTPPDEVTVEVKSAASHSVKDSLRGFVDAEDGESNVDIETVRVWLSDEKEENSAIVNSDGNFEFPAERLNSRSPKETKWRETLHVKVTNGAGLSVTKDIRITFFRKAKPVVKSAEPMVNGKVNFSWRTKSAYTVTLSGKNFFEEKMGTSPVVFDDVPPGTYRISWDTGVNTGNGNKEIKVKSGPPIDVTNKK
ncbi:MAG: hypothetical protein ABGZ53_24920 [Fuerstiella sp.]